MGLMTGSGPFGREPAGTFNFEPPSPGRALLLEPSPKRVRVQVGGETIADSRRVALLHESGHQPVYYFPPEDVRADVLEPSDRHTRCPKKGEASYYTIRAGEAVVDAGAWYYPDPIPGAPPIKDLVAFYWNRVDRWLEEDEEVFVHPRDPYHRVDVLRTNRHVQISLHGELLADSRQAVALFESNLPARWYVPAEDVVVELEPSATVSRCPYKGAARYYSARLGGEGGGSGWEERGGGADAGKDLIWYYPEPFAEVQGIAGLLCFFNEKVDVELDGELQQRPESPWSHGVKSDAQNAAPAQTRG